MSAHDGLLGAMAGAILVGAAWVGTTVSCYILSRPSWGEAQAAISVERIARIRAERRLAMEHREVVFLEHLSDEYMRQAVVAQSHSVLFVGRCDN
jgi:hypothetical protein